MDKSKEVHIICSVKCDKKNREQVQKLLLQYVEPSRQEIGCIYYDIYQKQDDLNAFYILDGWINQDAVELHKKHPNVLKVNSQLHPLLLEEPKLIFGKRISNLN